MEIIEKQIVGKRINISECEDEYVINDDFVAVIDGVTSKTELMLNNCTTGRFAAQTIAASIRCFKPDISMKDAISEMTKSIEKVYIENNLYEQAKENVSNRLAASVIIYSRYFNEIWSIGDCLSMVDGKVYTFSKKIDDIIADARALFIEIELINGKTVDELLTNDSSRNYFFPLLKSSACFENNSIISDYTFSVIDGFEPNEKYTHAIKVSSGGNIILASDGYPKLFGTLEESEKYLSHILKTDPLCYREFKSTKGLVNGNNSFDDRTYVRFRV